MSPSVLTRACRSHERSNSYPRDLRAKQQQNNTWRKKGHTKIERKKREREGRGRATSEAKEATRGEQKIGGNDSCIKTSKLRGERFFRYIRRVETALGAEERRVGPGGVDRNKTKSRCVGNGCENQQAEKKHSSESARRRQHRRERTNTQAHSFRNNRPCVHAYPAFLGFLSRLLLSPPRVVPCLCVCCVRCLNQCTTPKFPYSLHLEKAFLFLQGFSFGAAFQLCSVVASLQAASLAGRVALGGSNNGPTIMDAEHGAGFCCPLSSGWWSPCSTWCTKPIAGRVSCRRRSLSQCESLR